MGTILMHHVVVPDPGFLNLGDKFDSCITTTLTLFLSIITPSSVSLFSIPLVLSCRTLNVLSSLIYSVGGEGDKVGSGDCWVYRAEQVSQVQSLFLRYWAVFKIPEHFHVHPSRASGALVAHSSTCDVVNTYWTGVLCSRAWVRIYITRHL